MFYIFELIDDFFTEFPFMVIIIGIAVIVIGIAVVNNLPGSHKGYSVCQSGLFGNCFSVNNINDLHYGNGCIWDSQNRICGQFSVEKN